MEELVSTEPATGAVLWRGLPADVEEELETARAAWPDWAARPLTVRIELVRRFGNVVRARADPLGDLIARETGKPLWEAKAEVESLLARVDAAVAAYADRTSQRRLEGAMGARHALRHKPLGAVAVVTPYTFPAAIPAANIVPALIAGNVVLFKPSEKTPAVGEYLTDCFHAGGIPSGVVRCVVGGPAEATALAGHSQVDAMMFVGSPAAGMSVHRRFADTPHRMLSLELGGNNPLIVWDTPDLHSAAALIVQSAFQHSGQHCASARRLIVREGAHEPLLKLVSGLIDRLVIGAPHDTPAPFMGPLIDPDMLERAQEGFIGLLMKGGRGIRQLVRPFADRPYLQPAMIDVTGITNRPDEEIFGPVLQVIQVPDFDSAIREANATRFGVAAGLIGGNPELYDRFWANARAGLVNWNRPTTAAPLNAPFGPLGLSGNFRPGGSYRADQCAFPVVSAEADQPRAMIGIGLLDEPRQDAA